MGDKSPKATQKNASQKQTKNDASSSKKKATEDAKKSANVKK
jgi:hypothetical protein